MLGLVLAVGARAAPPLDPQAEAVKALDEALGAIRAGQLSVAELLLERSLMLDPELADARLELAGVLAQRGAVAEARALIQSLIDDFRTPDGHRARLLAMLEQTERARAAAGSARSPRSPEVRAEVFGGWTRNPFARADLQQLTLTFPEGRVTLPVAQKASPAGLHGIAIQRVSPDGWGLEAGALAVAGAESDQSFRIGLSGPLPGSPVPGGLLQWSVQAIKGLGGSDRYAAGLSWSQRHWRISGGRYGEPYLGRQGAYLRLERFWDPHPRVQSLAYLDAERASSGPPSFGRAGAILAISLTQTWKILMHASLQHDLTGYSPLLESGAPRAMRAFTAVIEKAWVPAPTWELKARLNLGRRWSNLELFEYRDLGAQLVLARRWR